MSSDSWLPAVKSTNVAARIRAYQDVQPVESQPASFSVKPRVMTQASESGTVVGRGTRSEANFAAPAGRAPRDGSEGVRGDGRPPVGTALHQPFPSVEESEMEEVVLRPTSRLAPRPHTSFGESRIGFSEARLRLRPVIAENKEEEGARGRTRGPTVGKQADIQEVETGTVRRRSKNNETLSELGDLIDNAIEDVGTEDTNKFHVDSPPAPRRSRSVKSPQRSFSQVASVRRAQSVIRRRRAETVEPRSSSETERVDYDAGQSTPVEINTTPPKQVLKESSPIKQIPARPIELQVPRPNIVVKGRSPVKERAAMFERMVRRSTPPTAVHTPPIPLALPRLLSPRPRSRATKNSSDETDKNYTTAPQSESSSGSETVIPLALPERKASNLWPFKWGLLSKSSAASPQQSDIARHAIADRDEHKPCTSNISSQVQNLVATANRSSKPGSVSVHELEEPIKDVAAVDEIHLPPLQVPVGEQQAMLAKNQPQTPLRPSASEKEVIGELGPPAYATPLRSDSYSRKKDASAPVTPIRGRREAAQLSPSGSAHAIEHRYALSRSRSRGGGMRVQVDVRTSPEKGSDDAIVIVRAEFDPIAEAGE